MRPDEGDAVVEIWRRAVDATHHFLSAVDRRDIETEVKAFLPFAPPWIAADASDRAVGFMLLDASYMEALFIDPAQHGRGVGRALVEHASARHRVLTTDVNAQSGPAAAFYARLGFAPTGRSEVDGQGRPYPLLHLTRRG